MVASLIITFFQKRFLNNLLEQITKTYEPSNGIWMLKTDDSGLLLSYSPTKKQSFLPNSILVHRKKETNTLYTINAMNELIKTINNGVMDPQYVVPWDNYKDKIILLKSGEFRSISFQLEKVFW